MQFVGDSIKFIESMTSFLGFVLLTEYKGKNIKLGFVMQGIFFYISHVMALSISLHFTGSAVKSAFKMLCRAGFYLYSVSSLMFPLSI